MEPPSISILKNNGIGCTAHIRLNFQIFHFRPQVLFPSAAFPPILVVEIGAPPTSRKGEAAHRPKQFRERKTCTSSKGRANCR